MINRTFVLNLALVMAGLNAARTVSAAVSATFIKTDSVSAGNWRSLYGKEGYSLAGDQSLNAPYAAPAPSAQSNWTWNGSTTDPRALQKASNPSDRTASCWYSQASFLIDTNISDTSSHQIALYLLDWDNYGRIEQIDVLDSSSNVLDTRTLSGNFTGGLYLVWNVSGHVTFRITNKGSNAVVSGIFLDPVTAAPQSVTASASFLTTDNATAGNWQSVYGNEGYSVVGDQTLNPAYAAPTASGQMSWTWAASTGDTRGLQKPSNPSDRTASCWYSSTTFTIDTNISDQATHQVALYFVDWDQNSRVERIDVLDSNGNVLDSRVLNGFSGGTYLIWSVSGHVKFRITNQGTNAVVSGLFFGGGTVATVPNTSATFVKTDNTTAGDWESVYGSDGYDMPLGQSLNASYSAPVVSGQAQWNWEATTPDPRGLQIPSTPNDRLATAWYSPSSFVIDTNISDAAVHQVALYLVDWDNLGRAEKVDVLDVNSNVLDSRTVSGFSGGIYLVWNVAGHIKFRITNQGPNAVVSGVFFGGAAAGGGGSVAVIPQLSRWQSRMLSGAAQYCVAGDIAGAIGSWGVGSEANVWYYDGTKVYQQIAAYTGDASWYTCAGYVNTAYTSWVLATTAGANWPVGALNGWRIFPDGALKDFQRTGNSNSSQTVLRLANNSAYAGSGGDVDCSVSRETAYIMNAYIAAEKMGQPRNPLLAQSVNFALGHIDQWFGSQSCGHVVPFMVGLTLEALMNYYELTKDPRIPPAIQIAADGLWSTTWVSVGSGFMYDTAPNGVGLTADLNLLIAPAYAWLWQMTGLQKYMDEGDQIFASGVLNAGFWTGKQFSQNYRSSFNYVKWRSSPRGSAPLTAFAY